MTTSTRSLPGSQDTPAKEKRFGLSWIQIIAAGFASITATVILSFFSISGTLIGAAVFSMASAVGNAVYQQSLRTTKERVHSVVRADPSSPTVVLPVVDGPGDEPGGEPGDGAGDDPDDDEPESEPRLPAAAPGSALPARAWKRVAVFALAIFATVMATVTTVELVAGRPLTDVLRGDDGSGTSLFGGTSGRQVDVPTVVVTVTPSVVYTTPTVTMTAPATTKTQTPTTTTTPSDGATTSDSPQPSDSSSGSDTTSPSGSSTRPGN